MCDSRRKLGQNVGTEESRAVEEREGSKRQDRHADGLGNEPVGVSALIFCLWKWGGSDRLFAGACHVDAWSWRADTLAVWWSLAGKRGLVDTAARGRALPGLSGAEQHKIALARPRRDRHPSASQTCRARAASGQRVTSCASPTQPTSIPSPPTARLTSRTPAGRTGRSHRQRRGGARERRWACRET